MTMPNGDTTVPEAKTSEQVASAQTTTPEAQPASTEAAKVTITPELQKLIDEAVGKAATAAAREAAALAKEVGRRELQSQQSRNRAEMARLEAKARAADKITEAVRGTEYEAAVVGADKDARLQTYEEREMQQAQLEQAQQARTEFYGIMEDAIKEVGIDWADKRLDRAEDATDAKTAQKRIWASVARIQKETTAAQEARLKADFKALESKLRQELGIDSVDTSTPVGGTIGNGIPRSMAAFNKWYAALPDKEKMARQEEINAALDRGDIR